MEEDGAIDTPYKIFKLLNYIFEAGRLVEEHVYLISFSVSSRVTGVFDVAKGGSGNGIPFFY